MSDEGRLMDLLAEGNPATDVAQGASTGVPAATYLATLEQRSSDVTKTDESARTRPPGPGRGLAWVLAGFALILSLGGLYFALNGDDSQVVDQTTVPTSTTALEPEPETMTDLEIIEAGVVALYSGDADTAVELFDLPAISDAEIREEATYQETVRGRLTLNCAEQGDGVFLCTIPYHNALTDAIGVVDSGDEYQIRVNQGQIFRFRTAFEPGFPEHGWINHSMGLFLLTEGTFYGYEECLEGPSSPLSCGRIQMENLDGWRQWYLAMDPVEVVNRALSAWYKDDCPVATAFTEQAPSDCLTGANHVADMIAYETAMGGSAATDNCVVAEEEGTEAEVTCDVGYSNAMNSAVDKAAAVITREFQVSGTMAPDWYAIEYPRDAALDASFAEYAVANGLEAYGASFCTTSPTPECAQLILDNLDDWATWHQNRQ